MEPIRKRVKYDTKSLNRSNTQSNSNNISIVSMFTALNQSNSDSINQSNNSSNSQSINQSISQSINQPMKSAMSSAIGQSKKKLVIKPFKVKPSLPAEFESNTLTILYDAVEAVFQSNNQSNQSINRSSQARNQSNQPMQQSLNTSSMHRSLEELYHAVQSLCSHKKSSQLYAQLIGQIDVHTKKVVEMLAQDVYNCVDRSNNQNQSNIQPNSQSFSLSANPVINETDENVLKCIVDVWHRHCAQLLTLRSIFLYLDRTFILHQSINQQNDHSMSDNSANNPVAGNSLWEIGLSIFRQYYLSVQLPVDHSFTLETTVRGAILRLFDCDRSSQSINQSILRDTCRFYQSIKLFDRLIDQSFYASTKQYYTAESNRSVSQFSLSDYLHHVEASINQERLRVTNILFSQSVNPANNQAINKTISIVQQSMVADHADRLTDASLDELLKQSKLPELKLMYNFYQAINQSMKLKDAFARYVKQTGQSIMNPTMAQTGTQSANQAINQLNQSIIPELLKFKRQLDVILDKSFNQSANQPSNQSLNQSTNFVHAMKVSFESFLNESNQSARSAELLAAYIDRLLRSRSVNQPIAASVSSSVNRPAGASNEDDIDQCIWVFRYIHAKDVFIAFYSSNLSKRLISQSINQTTSRSTNQESEELFLSKLKAECGSSFTKNCEQMFKDMDMSKSINQSINQSIKQSINPLINQSIDFQADILTSGCWPVSARAQTAATESSTSQSTKESINASSDFLVPAEIVTYQSEFQTHYLSLHTGRKLQWSNQLSSAILRANFKRGRRELVCNAMQASILCCFNPSINDTNESTAQSTTQSKSLSFQDLQQFTRIPEADLKRTLMSLACHQETRVLLKEPKNRTVDVSDVFRVDDNFTSSLFRIKLPVLSTKESVVNEAKETEKKVWEDRAYAIDAAIVRIMKARKTCSHNELISETISTLSNKFPVQVAEIKKRIGGLIEREYLERDAENSSVYQYLA